MIRADQLAELVFEVFDYIVSEAACRGKDGLQEKIEKQCAIDYCDYDRIVTILNDFGIVVSAEDTDLLDEFIDGL